MLFGGKKFENEKFTTNHGQKIFILKNWRMRFTEPEGLNEQWLGGGRLEEGHWLAGKGKIRSDGTAKLWESILQKFK